MRKEERKKGIKAGRNAKKEEEGGRKGGSRQA